jgi:hypothetical protein
MASRHRSRARRTQPQATLLGCMALGCLALACMPLGCTTNPDATSDDTNAATNADAAPWAGLPPSTTRDFLVTSITFDVPDGIKVQDKLVANPCGLKMGTDNTMYQPLILEGQPVDGFDLDGANTQDDGPCPHRDYVGPNGETGIDNGFLHVMDMIRPARPGQTIETVLRSAPSQGLIRIGIRLSGVDSLENDPEVGVLIVTTAETPLLGTNGEILAGSSVRVDDDPAFRSALKGQIVDGVLYAGPGDVTMGKVNLLVAQNRVIALKDARVRATVKPHATGGYEVDARLAGWWQRDSMMEAIGEAILTIGANPGELSCVLDNYADHALDGKTCDAMSTIIHTRAVTGFITGLPDAIGGL